MKDSNVVNMDFNSGPFKGMSIGLIFLIILAIIVLSKAILVVNAGERAVVMNKVTGVEERTLGEGLHFLIPGIQEPTIYSVRTQTYTMAQEGSRNVRTTDDAPLVSLTSDGQKITMDMSVRYNLIPEKVWKLHQKVGPYYEEKIIKPEVRSVARNTISTYPVLDVYSEKRMEIQNQIQEQLKKTLENYDINLSEVLIRNVKFSEEFARAIEMKQVALQEAERMKYVLEKEKQEKQRKIIEAQGEAEAIKEKGTALRANPQLIQYEYVQKLTPGIKTVITDQTSIMNFPEDLLKE